MNCECQNWERVINPKYFTNHHEHCPHYNDSLIDVWRVQVEEKGPSAYYSQPPRCEDEFNPENGETCAQEKMHREVFERLPEFGGF